MPELGDKLQNPLDNLRVAKEYLEMAHSDIPWRANFWQIVEDTVSINMASELGGEVGSFGAGAMSNKIADGYMNEMVETVVSINQQEELNLAIFKQTAREHGIDADKVRGTGVFREFVPDYIKVDICGRLVRNSRPDSWDSEDFPDDGIILRPSPRPKPDGSPTDGVARNLPVDSDIASDSSLDLFPNPLKYDDEKAQEEAEKVVLNYCPDICDVPDLGEKSMWKDFCDISGYRLVELVEALGIPILHPDIFHSSNNAQPFFRADLSPSDNN